MGLGKKQVRETPVRLTCTAHLSVLMAARRFTEKKV